MTIGMVVSASRVRETWME